LASITGTLETSEWRNPNSIHQTRRTDSPIPFFPRAPDPRSLEGVIVDQMFPSHRLCSTPPRRPRGHPLFEWRLGRAKVCIGIKKRPGPRFATPHGDSEGRTGTQSPFPVRSNPPISPKPEPTHRGTDPPRPLWLSAGRYIVCKHPMVTLCIIPFLGILHVSFRAKKTTPGGFRWL